MDWEVSFSWRIQILLAAVTSKAPSSPLAIADTPSVYPLIKSTAIAIQSDPINADRKSRRKHWNKSEERHLVRRSVVNFGRVSNIAQENFSFFFFFFEYSPLSIALPLSLLLLFILKMSLLFWILIVHFLILISESKEVRCRRWFIITASFPLSNLAVC